MTMYQDADRFSADFICDSFERALDLVHDPARACERVFDLTVALMSRRICGTYVGWRRCYLTAVEIVTDEIYDMHPSDR